MNDLLLGAVALGDQIERFGAYLGYAAIVGLGVLSLLYFAQAREVKRLREWAAARPSAMPSSRSACRPTRSAG